MTSLRGRALKMLYSPCSAVNITLKIILKDFVRGGRGRDDSPCVYRNRGLATQETFENMDCRTKYFLHTVEPLLTETSP